ncbi:MAG: MotA/TolQ/ExbB proton channel family protein [Zetaproteobacteria bacterium]|nr:MotA/TolQ/ExbB proton channel family protein [Zetaproteobacteria bacterium]
MADNVYQKAIDQRGLKTLVVWLGWLISSVAVFALLYRDADMLQFVMQDKTRMTWVILGMFFLGVLISFYHVSILTAEWFRAYRLEGRIKEQGLLSMKSDYGHRCVDCYLNSLRLVLERSGPLDLEGLAAVEFAGQRRMSQFVGLIGNLLITLGLIGTVFGMTLIMTGLNGALNAIGEDQHQMIDSLSRAMSGMGIAFYTTLLGSVLGGILLRVFAWITDASVESLQDKMVRAVMVYGASDLNPLADQEMRTRERELGHLQSRAELTKIALEASRQEMESLTETMEKMHATIKEAAADDSMYKLAAQHAKYVRSVSLWGRILDRNRNKQ